MGNFRIKLTGTKKLESIFIDKADELKRSLEKLPNEAKTFARNLSQSYLRELSQHAPKLKGKLKKSFSVTVVENGPLTFTIIPKTSTPYGVVIARGGGEHDATIVAKKAPFLKFLWTKQGIWVQKVKIVNHHPGVKAQNYDEKAWSAVESNDYKRYLADLKARIFE